MCPPATPAVAIVDVALFEAISIVGAVAAGSRRRCCCRCCHCRRCTSHCCCRCPCLTSQAHVFLCSVCPPSAWGVGPLGVWQSGGCPVRGRPRACRRRPTVHSLTAAHPVLLCGACRRASSMPVCFFLLLVTLPLWSTRVTDTALPLSSLLTALQVLLVEAVDDDAVAQYRCVSGPRVPFVCDAV